MVANSTVLSRLITAKRMRTLAGDVWFARGEVYCANGHVRSLRHDGNMIVGSHAVSATFAERRDHASGHACAQQFYPGNIDRRFLPGY